MSFHDLLCNALQHNPEGWGPRNLGNEVSSNTCNELTATRGDQLGRVSDWAIQFMQDRKPQYLTNTAQYSRFQAGGASNTVSQAKGNEEDESFQFVHLNKAKKNPGYQKSLKQRLQQQKIVMKQKQQREERQIASSSKNIKLQKLREREHQKAGKKWQKTVGSRFFQTKSNPMRLSIQPSIEIRHSWELLKEMEFASLNKLNINFEYQPEELKKCGQLESYDPSFDRILPKTGSKLINSDRITYRSPGTREDPIIIEMSKRGVAKVFATDSIVAALMTSTRSFYPWDVVIHRINDLLFFDKRDVSHFDYPTVNENSSDPPQDTPGQNSMLNLSLEAMYIEQNFAQQVLKKDKNARVLKMENPNPFIDSLDSVPSVAYRYKRWDLKDVPIVIRCESNAFCGDRVTCNVKTLNEYDPKITNDWRKKLEAQKGAVVATELKNNSCKLAKWSVACLLGGTELIKVGYVSREMINSPKTHIILCTQDFNPTLLASQLNLDMGNCWGIFHVLVQECLKLPEGKYYLIRDFTKAVLRLYKTSGESEDESSSDENTQSDRSDGSYGEN